MRMRRYIVHCLDGDTPRTRWVEGVTVEDAALAYLADWEPERRHDAARLIVCNAVTGDETELTVTHHDHV
ncbi:MAG: DUF5961 family protein [Pseudomonadota bacterium]